MLTALEGFFAPLTQLNFFTAALRLAATVLLGGLIGVERGRHGRAAGMRTHILVCLGSTLTMLVGLYAAEFLNGDADPLRISAQVISGIGFLGAGTILIKERQQVTGLTTAAGLWATAAVGLAIGIGFLGGAILTTLFILLANRFLPALERTVTRTAACGHIYAELSDPASVQALLDHLNQLYQVDGLQVVPARSATQGHLGLEFDLRLSKSEEICTVCRKLQEEMWVAFAVESI